MRNKIEEALGDWNEASIRVKERILETTVQQPARKKPFNKSVLIFIAAILVCAISAFTLWQYSGAPSIPKQSSPVPDNSELSPLEEQPSGAYRIPDEKTLQIAKYELFYNNSNFYSNGQAHIFAIYDVMEWYTLFYHLEKYKVFWPDDRKAYYRERATIDLEHLLKDDTFAAYFAQLKQDLSITDDDYIDYYLLPKYEYDVQSTTMFNSGVGLDEQGFYLSGDAENELKKIMAITDEYLIELATKNEEPLFPLVDETPTHDFEEDIFLGNKLTINEDGQLVLGNPSYFDFDVIDSVYGEFLYREFGYEYIRNIKRITLKQVIQNLADYKSDSLQDMKTAEQTKEILEILERSLEWDIDLSRSFYE